MRYHLLMVNIPRGSQILFLDDMKERHDSFLKRTIGCIVHWAKTADEAVEMLGHMSFDGVFLDHDLSDDHYCAETRLEDPTTGQHVANWIRDNATRFPTDMTVVVHSMNPTGSQRMLSALQDGGVRCLGLSFDRLLLQLRVVEGA